MTIAAATRRRSATGSLLREIRAEQAAQRAILESILQALERAHGPRDAADRSVLVAIAETIGERRWTSGQLLAHAAIAPALHDALLAADITDARELGAFCKRVQGGVRSGICLEKDDESRAGILWRVVVDASQ